MDQSSSVPDQIFLRPHQENIYTLLNSSHYTWTILALTTLLTALTSYTIYQLHFHPLASHPGPLLGRLTQLYDLYHAYIGDKHILYHHLHQKYGPIVRFSPNSLSINDPAALKTIYAHGANVQKSVFYKCFRAAPTAISTLLATEKQHHARKRRIMGQAFSESALRGFEGFVVGHVEDLVGRIGEVVGSSSSSSSRGQEGEKWSAPLDMANWCNWLVFDIMGDLVFGRSFGTLGEKPENRRGIFLLGRAARRNYTIAAMPMLLYTGLEKVLPILRGLYLDRCQYLAFGKKQVMERTREGAGSAEPVRRDIFSFLLHAKDPESGAGMPMPELWMEGNTLIVAGSDTTSTTLSATLHYLLHGPHTLHRLESEILSTFSSPSEIAMGPKLQSCTYLRAVLDETLRMTPAVGGLLPREVLPDGLSIPSLDLHLPAGVDVGVPIYAIHHHKDYVVDPFVFDPERWIREDHAQDREKLMSVFNPFSIGHRGCLGKPLVYMELGIAVARLVWEFEMRLSEVQRVSGFVERDVRRGRRVEGEYHLLDWFMSRNEGPRVEFRRRER
ncbi:unnamed protein product [Zymoseptoria tritici ST99CH_1A5]|uniref:Uncharacterized protein n=1 Tax=Zymoseptoria tritici ST99CH_1A5 TaxID=1276529 RepID=A0A1Y6LV57_ZYMTR|nr:unnamed protein product [Zymoseptoria tritici ST99CH_1A5]